MLLFKTAYKNIIGAGRRTWLNVAVLSFVMVVMVGYNGFLDGWFDESRREACDWEFGAGQFRSANYDPYDPFTLQDAHEVIPVDFERGINSGEIAPMLVTPATAFPNGRMQNVILKGIPENQNIVKIPSAKLSQIDGEIPIVIGEKMAAYMGLSLNDRIMVRWRDKNGVFDAREFLVVEIFDSKYYNVDNGIMWLNIEDLRSLTVQQREATYLVCSKTFNTAKINNTHWIYNDLNVLLADVKALEQQERTESFVIFVILLAIALLAIFDTQTLSIFRRRREIGTYVALGMPPRKVVWLFTIEGVCFCLLAIVVSFIWGTPILWAIGKYGWKLPQSETFSQLVMGDVLYPVYKLSSIIATIAVLTILSGVISYIPASKISRMNIVSALKGKID